MFYLSENLKKYRSMKNLTQEDVAEYLGVTPQSISKWERGECYPDITFLPALTNIFETSIDLAYATASLIPTLVNSGCLSAWYFKRS